jgi:hypothetical protein
MSGRKQFPHCSLACLLLALFAACGGSTAATSTTDAPDEGGASSTNGTTGARASTGSGMTATGDSSNGVAGETTGRASSSGADASGSSCVQGDTRPCIGPGGCRGGQICLSNAMWSSCDCGTASSGGGTDGMSSTSSASEGGLAASDAEAGLDANDEEVESGAVCPDNILLDCSGDCIARSSACTDVCDVSKAAWPNLMLQSVEAGKTYTIRTGKGAVSVFSGCGCGKSGPPGPITYFMNPILTVELPGDKSYRVSTEGPWVASIQTSDSYDPCGSFFYSSCVRSVTNPARSPLIAVTITPIAPSAPPANILVEVFGPEAGSPPACPDQ